MSSINTNSLDVNYPIPGQNNTTQGFRNNFTNIKTNLDIAGDEISDLQNKVVLKSALANSILNNDMANTVIANAATLQFRGTTYNLGNALTGNVLVNCSLGDLQYGNIAGNIVVNFGSWAPTNTLSTIKLQLGRPNNQANYSVTFSSNAVVNQNTGWSLLENSTSSNGIATITFPYDVTQLNLVVTSTDCGNSLTVTPANRPYKATQIQIGTPPSTGQLGDTVGTTYVDQGAAQLVISGANTDPFFTTSSTTDLYTGLPVVFTGTSLEANIVVGNTYYVRNVVSSTTFTVSSSIGGANIAVAANATGTTMLLNPVQYMYVAVDNYNSTANNLNLTSSTAPNIVTVAAGTINSKGVSNNQPVIFTGNVSNITAYGLEANTVYYIKTAYDGNGVITLSKTRYNGIAGPEYQGVLTPATPATVDMTAYTNGNDIFRRISLQPF